MKNPIFPSKKLNKDTCKWWNQKDSLKIKSSLKSKRRNQQKYKLCTDFTNNKFWGRKYLSPSLSLSTKIPVIHKKSGFSGNRGKKRVKRREHIDYWRTKQRRHCELDSALCPISLGLSVGSDGQKFSATILHRSSHPSSLRQPSLS